MYNIICKVVKGCRHIPFGKQKGHLTMLKTLTHEVSYDDLSDLINGKFKDAELIDYMQGSLNDEYLFNNVQAKQGIGVIIGRKHKPRKYIIVRENYLNEWSSDALVIETDSDKKALQFLKEVDNSEIPSF